MLDAGFIEPASRSSVWIAVPHFSVPKPHDPRRRRVVGDFRLLNKYLSQEECEYPGVEALWLRFLCSTRVATCDVEDGFYQVTVPPAYRQYFGIIYNGEWYRHTRMPHGFINSPAIFTRFMKKLLPDDSRIQFYMDDIFSFDMDRGELATLVNGAGLPLQLAKTADSAESPAAVLGVSIRHTLSCVEISPLPKAKTKHAFLSGFVGQPRSKRDYYAYAGFVQFYTPFLPKAPAHLFSLYRAANACSNWDDCVQCSPDVFLPWPFMLSIPLGSSFCVKVGASQEGYGLCVHRDKYVCMQLSHIRMDEAWLNTPGVYRELQAVRWAKKRLKTPLGVWRGDSEPVVLALESQNFSKWSSDAQGWLQVLKKTWIYVRGCDNFADDASRPLFLYAPSEARARHIHRTGQRNELKKSRQRAPPPPTVFEMSSNGD